MKTKKPVFKIIMTIFFGILILGALIYSIVGKFENDSIIKREYLYYGCTCSAFLFSLFFVRGSSKKIITTIALAGCVVADCFLVLLPNTTANIDIGLYVFCGVQAAFIVYTMFLNKGVGTRIFNLASRALFCVVGYFVLIQYFPQLTLKEIIAIMYLINAIITLFIILCHIKTDWILFIGFFLFLIGDVVLGLLNGGMDLFGISGGFATFLQKADEILISLTMVFYIPALYIIACSSVWAKKKED